MRRLPVRTVPMLWLTGWVFFLVIASATWRPLHAQAATSEPDPFQQCVADGSGSETACLARLGVTHDWRATEAACRFVEGKTGAIIEAGGQVRWIELFYNERCARLGLPHDATAAAAGAKVDFESPFVQCAGTEKFKNVYQCYELLGRHSFHPRWESFCVLKANWIRKYRTGEYPLSIYGSFQHERCWRLGLDHYKADQPGLGGPD